MLRVDLDAPGGIMLNLEAAMRLGLKGGLFGARAYVGPVKLTGAYAKKSVRIGGTDVKLLIVWFDRNYAKGVDGVINPASLPFDIVRFGDPTATGGRDVTLPMSVDLSGIHTNLQANGIVVSTRFALGRKQTATNATGGQLLVQAFGGEKVGEPQRIEIAYGIERPMQRFMLKRPAAAGAALLRDIYVRTAGAEISTDPEEVVVVAGKKGGNPTAVLTVGRDALDECGLLEMNNVKHQLRMNCR